MTLDTYHRTGARPISDGRRHPPRRVPPRQQLDDISTTAHHNHNHKLLCTLFCRGHAEVAVGRLDRVVALDAELVYTNSLVVEEAAALDAALVDVDTEENHHGETRQREEECKGHVAVAGAVDDGRRDEWADEG